MNRAVVLVLQHQTGNKSKYKIFDHTPEGDMDIDIIAFSFGGTDTNSWQFWHGDTEYTTLDDALAASDLTYGKDKHDENTPADD